MPKSGQLKMPRPANAGAGRSRRLNTDTPPAPPSMAPASGNQPSAAAAVAQNDAYQSLVSRVATAYRTGSAQEVETLYNIGQYVVELTSEKSRNTYGERRVEGLSADLKKIGVKLGRSMLYDAQRFVTMFTREQMLEGVRVGMSVRNIKFLVTDRLTDAQRSKAFRSLTGGEIKPEEFQKHIEETVPLKAKKVNKGLPKNPTKLATRLTSVAERFVGGFVEPAKAFVTMVKGMKPEDRSDKVFVKQAKATLSELNKVKKSVDEQIKQLEKIVE